MMFYSSVLTDPFKEAVEALEKGLLVGLPTETVYGLAADASNSKAVALIYTLKQRPQFNPLILHFADQEDLDAYVYLTPLARTLLETFSPGPLTLVLDKKPEAQVSDLVTAGLETLAIRLPSHPMARDLLKAFGKPLAAPSANPSESLSPTKAQDVLEGLGQTPKMPIVLDGGACAAGLESTILDARGERPILLRPGSLSLEEIHEKTGLKVEVPSQPTHINAPGQMKRHYAPKTPLRLEAITCLPHEALLSFGPTELKAQHHLSLSPSGNLNEAATNLFSMLRSLDRLGVKAIAVTPIPQHGLGLAINDRLQRAAEPPQPL